MAAAEQNIEKKLIQCPICYEIFNCPKSLPCSHSFCELCLEKYITSAITTTSKTSKDVTQFEYLCPLCRTRVPAPVSVDPSEWAKNLPTDPLILGLLQKQIPHKTFCDVCEKEETKMKVEASMWCIDCKRSLCDNCLRLHNKFSPLENHRVFAFDDLQNKHFDIFSSNINFCEDHPRKKVKMFCIDHNIPCCYSCVMMSHRKCDNLVDIENATKNLHKSSDLNKLSEDLNDTDQEFNKLVRDRKQNMETLYEEKDKIEEEITKLRQELDDQEERIRTDLSLIHKQQTTELEKQATDFENGSKIISNCKNMLDASRNNVSDIQMFLLVNKISKLHEQQIRLLKRMKLETKRIDYQMTINPSFYKLKTVLSSFGDIEINESSIPGINVSDFHLCKALELDSFRPFSCGGVYYTGIAFLPESRFVNAVREKRRLDVYSRDKSHEFSIPLQGDPFDVSVLNENNVAVTIPKTKEIHFIRLDDKTSKKVITTEHECYGLDCNYNTLVVLCNTVLEMRTLDGDLVKLIQIQGGEGRYVSITNTDRIYFTSCNTLHCITTAGDDVFKYEADSELYGVTVDCEDNAYVAVYNNGDILQLDRKGRLIQTIASGIRNPRSLNFQTNGNKLLVTFYQDEIKLFELKHD